MDILYRKNSSKIDRGNVMKKIMPVFLIWMNIIEIILYLRKKKILDADMKQWKKYHPYSKEGISH